MALKNRIDQLIRDEWNKPEIAQLTLWDTLKTYDKKNGSCVSSTRDTHERSAEPTHERSAEPTPKLTHEPT